MNFIHPDYIYHSKRCVDPERGLDWAGVWALPLLACLLGLGMAARCRGGCRMWARCASAGQRLPHLEGLAIEDVCEPCPLLNLQLALYELCMLPALPSVHPVTPEHAATAAHGLQPAQTLCTEQQEESCQGCCSPLAAEMVLLFRPRPGGGRYAVMLVWVLPTDLLSDSSQRDHDRMPRQVPITRPGQAVQPAG